MKTEILTLLESTNELADQFRDLRESGTLTPAEWMKVHDAGQLVSQAFSLLHELK